MTVRHIRNRRPDLRLNVLSALSRFGLPYLTANQNAAAWPVLIKWVEAIEADFFTHEFEESFDIITMFGVAPCLQFIFPKKDRLSALLRLLDRALAYTHFGIAFSFLNHNCYESAEREEYEYVYYYPEEICTLLTGARFDLSTVHNDLVSSCFLYAHDALGLPFRFNLNRIDSVLHLLR